MSKFKNAVLTIPTETINRVIDGDKDYVKFVHNVGGIATIEEVDYSTADDDKTAANGDIYCDKDSFLKMAYHAGLPW